MTSDTGGQRYLSVFKAVMMTLGALGVVSSFSYVGGVLGGASGNASWLVMLIATGLTMCVACALSAFAHRYVVTGSIMSYLAEVFGSWARLIVGSSYLLGYVVALSTILLGSAYYINNVLVQIHVGEAGILGEIVLISGTAVLAGLLTIRGLDTSATVVTILTLMSIPGLAVITGGVLRTEGLHLQPQLLLAGASAQSIMTGIGIGLAFYIGFDGCASLATDTRNPKRNVPIILLSSIAACGALMVVAGCLVQVPALASHTSGLNAGVPPMVILATIGHVGFLALPLSVTFVFATFSSATAFMNFAARIFAKASTDGMLPRKLKVVHPRYHTPVNAVILLVIAASALPSSILVLTRTPALTLMVAFSAAMSYFWFPPYFLVCVGALRLYGRERQHNIFAVIAYIVGAVGVLAIALYNLINRAPGLLGTVPFISLGAVGVLSIAYIWRARQQTAARAGA